MDVVVVVALGVAAGVAVYVASMRWARPVPASNGDGFLPEEPSAPPESAPPAGAPAATAPAGAYVPLAPGRRSVQTRLLGMLGIAVLVPIAAITFALAVYAAGRVIVETVTRLVEHAST